MILEFEQTLIDFQHFSTHSDAQSLRPGATALPCTALAPVGTFGHQEVAEDAAVALAAAEDAES